MKPFHVYLLRCADDSYYCGHTDDLVARLEQHHIGAGGYTASRRPVEVVWHGEFESRAEALAFEQQHMARMRLRLRMGLQMRRNR